MTTSEFINNVNMRAHIHTHIPHTLTPHRHTEHSPVSLAQQWDQLRQMVMRMQHNLEQQIQARNTIGVSEEQLKEFTASFK